MATCQLVVLHTPENPHSKRAWLEKVFRSAPSQALVLTNSESIPLAELQAEVPDPSRLLGLNWVYPAHRTLFAELLSTAQNREEEVQAVFELIASDWGKDPYRLRQGRGIRSRLMAAMVREAFYLIENGYVEIADIDRACRNDPGYYLPFAGNCRYMDLMGTYIYGLVMKDLNPELSNAKEVPEFFDRFVASGRLGWKSGEGCYRYRSDEILRLREVFRKFSGEMAALMQRYPFPEGRFPVQPDASSGYHEKKYHARPWVEKNTKK
jgi:3-hydroxybutyryl-CoA dehydrogenase